MQTIKITNKEVLGLCETIEAFRAANPDFSFTTLLAFNKNMQELDSHRVPIEEMRKQMYRNHGETNKQGQVVIKADKQEEINKQWDKVMDDTTEIKFTKVKASVLGKENGGRGPRSCNNIWDILKYMVDIDVDDFMQEDNSNGETKKAIIQPAK